MVTTTPAATFWWRRIPPLVVRVPRKNHFYHVTRQQRYSTFIQPFPKVKHLAASSFTTQFTAAIKIEPTSLLLRNVHNKTPDNNQSSSSSGVVDFLLGDIGEGIAEVELIKWFVSPGDDVTQFQKVCEVQSDKATVEITSRFDGTVLELKHEVGETIPTGSILLTLTSPHGVSSPSSPPSSPIHGKTAATTPPQVFSTADEAATNQMAKLSTKLITTPAVRKLLKENDLDAKCVRDLIPASGPGGRVLKSDVLSFLNRSSSPDGVAQHEVCKDDKGEPIRIQQPHKSVKLNAIQKAMVNAMDSALSIPHMLFCDEIIMEQLLDTRNKLRNVYSEEFPKMSHLPILIKALSLALDEYPQMNSSLSSCRKEILMYPQHNIGIAIDSPRGLVVPCIQCVEKLSILDIARELRCLREKAADGKLSQADLGLGGAKESKTTFSISNIGSLGGTYCNPIITPPQVGIVALGRISRIPRFVSDDSNEVVATKILNVSFSADHRVIDGGTLARFSNRFKLYLEHPTTMLSATR